MTRNVKAERNKNHFPRVIHQIGLFTSFETAPHNQYCKFVCLNYLNKLSDFTRVAIGRCVHDIRHDIHSSK